VGTVAQSLTTRVNRLAFTSGIRFLPLRASVPSCLPPKFFHATPKPKRPVPKSGLFITTAYDCPVQTPSGQTAPLQTPPKAASPIPQHLLRSPRPVRRKPGTLGPLLLGRVLTAPVLLAAAALLALAVFEPVVVFLLPAQPARVVRQWSDYKAHQGSTDYVEYQFDRSGFTARDEVLPTEYSAFQLGQPVQAHLFHLGPLHYSALDRSPAAYARYRMILWLGVSFGLAIGGVLFYAIWLLPWRSRWLAQNGQATFGAVVEKSIIRAGRRHISFTLTYQFKVNGDLWARRIRISPYRYDDADLKDLVIILFDPKRPRHSIVYDYCDFIAS
jgi:hypothetical protein